MGSIFHPLSKMAEEEKIINVAWDLDGARSWLTWLLNDNLVTIVISRNAAQSLVNIINDIIPANYKDFSSIDSEKTLGWLHWYRINNGIKDFETVFSAELQNLDTYFVIQKLAYVTHDLIENGEKVLPQNVINRLPEEAIVDIRQAGRCIAFELPTGAGYHIMRATEKVLRIYYEQVIGESPAQKVWAGCITALKQSGKANDKILSIFDQIRDLHRNPLMHPEVFLGINEALTLFDIAKSAITVMVDEIIKKES